jgi:NADPH:quinone reductase
MKAIVVKQFGGPDVLQLAEVPTPQPAAGQILVKIAAIGVNPADTYMRTGTYAVKPQLPYTPGGDAAGTIEALGSGVTGWKKGDRVYLTGTLTGAYAEYALATPAQVHPLSQRASFAQGAAMHVPYCTAYYALFLMVDAKPGETILVHGASGGVGIATVQLARAHGMRVIGTASSAEGRELVKREGAHETLDHKDPKHFEQLMQLTGGAGANVIVEFLANVNLGNDLKILAQKGRVAVIGSRGDVQITPRDLMGKMGSIHAMTLWGATPAELVLINAALVAGLENGTLRPAVGAEIPLAEAARAHVEVIEHQGGTRGKIVLIP